MARYCNALASGLVWRTSGAYAATRDSICIRYAGHGLWESTAVMSLS